MKNLMIQIESILELKKQLEIAEKKQTQAEEQRIADYYSHTIGDQAINIPHYIKKDQEERKEVMKFVESLLNMELTKLRQSLKCTKYKYIGPDHRIGVDVHKLTEQFDYLGYLGEDHEKIESTLNKIIELDKEKQEKYE